MKLTIRRANGTDITLDGVDDKLSLELEPDGSITLDGDDGFKLQLTRVESVTTAFERTSSLSRPAPPPPRPLGGPPTSTVPRTPGGTGGMMP